MTVSLLNSGNGIQIKKFKLTDNFINKYKDKKPPFGFNGLGELTYLRTYSRIKSNGDNEQWYETVKRVVEGTYTLQKMWIESNNLGWNGHTAQRSAQEMYDRMFDMKFLPPGRGIWAMGTDIIYKKGLFETLSNCSFCSTDSIKDEPSDPFCFLMNMSMLGVGVGFDIEGKDTIIIKGPKKEQDTFIYKIPDTREGWVESLRLLLDSYFHGTQQVGFDYINIRAKGKPLKTFGGISSGPDPLIEMHAKISAILDNNIGELLSGRNIVDIMNLIGVCVVSGNVRRSSEIVFGAINDTEYLELKNYTINPDRVNYGWASNNSVFANLGDSYKHVVEKTCSNGEPGYAWLYNMRSYGRMVDVPDNKDFRVKGANPCCEQSLESRELCTLVETFINKHDSIEDYKRTLKFAYLYAKTVTLGKTAWAETNRIMLRNRRIGCSISGIAQFIASRGIDELKNWANEGYKAIQEWDTIYSEWLAIPKSIKTTSIKPSGTVSLLAGATPGVHYPISRYYIRRIRLADNSPLLEPLKKAGYKIEQDAYDKSSMVVEFLVDVGEGVRTLKDITMYDQLNLAAFMQRYWADNQVSCTITFKENEVKHIETALNFYQYQLKGISFLPESKNVYAQMPYEEITEEEYNKRIKVLKPLDLSNIKDNKAEVEKYCNGDSCDLIAFENTAKSS